MEQELKPIEESIKLSSVDKTESVFINALERVEKQQARTIKTLNEEFSYKVKVGSSDKVNINSNNINSNSKRVNNITIVVNSEQAKKDIHSKTGIDFNALIKKADTLKNKECVGLLKASMSRALKKVARDIL